MSNFGPLSQSPAQLQSATGVKAHYDIEEHRAQLLELRTEGGPVYVCPSPWQRLRLQWAFRHFRVLPPQLLSRRDQRLIEELSRSATITPILPVPNDAVFGVVEEPGRRSGQTKRSAVLPNEPLTTKASRARSGILGLRDAQPMIPEVVAGVDYSSTPRRSRSISLLERFAWKRSELNESPAHRETWTLPDFRLRRWGAVVVLFAACAAVILARFYMGALFPAQEQAKASPVVSGTTSTINQPANRAMPVAHKPVELPALANSPVRALVPAVPLFRRPGALLSSDSTPPQHTAISSPTDAGATATRSELPMPTPAAHIPSITPAPIFVTELPQGHFAYPVVPQRNPAGELQLRAVIGTDGSVKDVSVVSGDPKLAEAGTRAVRQWHYTPYQTSSGPVEVQTQIKMNFFGRDAVSISSVGNTTK